MKTRKFPIKINYIIIPIIVVLVAVIGNIFTSSGIDSGWYDTIIKPSWTPDGSIIGTVWTIIFILTTISALIFWNQKNKSKNFEIIVWIFAANAALNILWSLIFFGLNILEVAVIEAALLAATTIGLIIFLWPISKLASALIIPYAVWVSFATYLTFVIYSLNYISPV